MASDDWMDRKLPATTASPWMRIREASDYVGCGPKLLYRSVREGKLKAARLGGRRDLVFRQSWLDDFVEAGATTENPAESATNACWGGQSPAGAAKRLLPHPF